MRALMQRAHTPKFEKAGRAMKAFEALHHDVVGPFWISFHFVSPSCIAAGTVNFGGVASFVGARNLLRLLLALFLWWARPRGYSLEKNSGRYKNLERFGGLFEDGANAIGVDVQ